MNNSSDPSNSTKNENPLSKEKVKKENLSKFPAQKHRIRKQKQNLMKSKDNAFSNDSSNQQKSSDSSYNLNYIINNLNNEASSMKKNEDFLYNQQVAKNLQKNMMNPCESDYFNNSSNNNLNNMNNLNNLNNMNNLSTKSRFNNLNNIQAAQSIQETNINYNSNYPFCMPIQMGQQSNIMSHFPCNNQMTNGSIPFLYHYGNMNQNNSLNFAQLNPQQNNILLQKNMYIPNNMPNYMLAPNNNNNSYQILQVQLQPVANMQNLMFLQQDRMQNFVRNNNNSQGSSYVLYPLNNFIPNQGAVPKPPEIKKNIDEMS